MKIPDGVFKIIVYWCYDVAIRVFSFLAVALTVAACVSVLNYYGLISVNDGAKKPRVYEGLGGCGNLLADVSNKISTSDSPNGHGYLIDDSPLDEGKDYINVTYHGYGVVFHGTCKIESPYDFYAVPGPLNEDD
jgi:hypothetical protein